MAGQTFPVLGNSEITSDMMRKLVGDADVVTRLAPLDPSLLEGSDDEMLAELIRNYDALDKKTRQDLRQLAEVLNDSTGQALRAVVCRPGSMEVVVSADKLSAQLTVQSPEGGGRVITAQDVIMYLKSAGIIYGVDMAAITGAVHEGAREGKVIGPVAIASGRAPVVGAAGRLEVAEGRLIAPASGQKRTRQWMVKAGEVLMKVIAPTAGEAGMTVMGEPLPAQPGQAVTIDTGEGVIVDPVSGDCIAAIDGLATLDGEHIEVRRQLFWSGDLTLNDPPIEFDGSVMVAGTVCDGAQVSATGDIEIRGGVEGATVISRDGAVTIREGIVGRNRGFVSAKTVVDVRHIEHATIYCAGNVLVRHAMLHSRVVAGKTVRVDLGKGVIFGGDVRAGVEILAKSIGNAAGVPTHVSVGHDWASLELLRAEEAVLAKLAQQAESCDRVIQQFRHARPDPSRLTQTERGALSAVIKRYIVLKRGIEVHQARYTELDSAWSLTGVGHVNCIESMFAGTTVKMGSATVKFDSNLPGCTLTFNQTKGKIVGKNSFGREIKID